MPARRRLTFATAVAAVALALPTAPAQAKGIASASVCGADGCTMVAHGGRDRLQCPGCRAEELMSIARTAYPKRRAPYLRIVLAFGAAGETFGSERLLYAPALELVARRSDLRGDWSWYEPTPPGLDVVRRLVRGISPYPAARMPLGIAAPAPVTHLAPNADAAGPPLLAGAALLAATACAVTLATRRRRRRPPALGRAA